MKEFILMEVTAETIRDYGISRNEVEWCRIGNRRVQAVKVLATYEVFTFYKRSVLREQQQECRAKHIQESQEYVRPQLRELYTSCVPRIVGWCCERRNIHFRAAGDYLHKEAAD